MILTNEVLLKLKPEDKRKEIFKEYYQCSIDGRYCIENYFTVMSKLKRVPFKLFPHQIDTYNAFEKYTNCISMKSRQMGFTTFTSAYIAWKICTVNNFKVLIVSKTMPAAKEFVKIIKDILDEARKNYPWLICDYLKGYNNKESFHLTNGSIVKAEATSESAGRGLDGMSLIVGDEVAFIDRRSPGKMAEIWASVSPSLASTQGKAIMISTPKGTSGWYYDTYTNAKEKGFHIIDAHWTRHPIYSLGQYQWIPDSKIKEGGKLKFFDDKPWPEAIFEKEAGTYIKVEKEKYKFITDGKIRSPWYDMESSKISPHLVKCELDCSFAGTGGEVLDSDKLREMKQFAEAQIFTKPFEKLKGFYTEYREFFEYTEGDKYVISSDVCTGDGSDFSTIVVLNLTKFRIEGTFKANIYPKALAQLLKRIGSRFGNPMIVVENQGGGFTTLQELKDLRYGAVYYSTLNKKDPTTGMKKKKIGLWASEEVRSQGGDLLEEAIRTNDLVIPCTNLITEFYTWIWDKDGRRRHAPDKHDDLIIALQHSIWYSRYVYKRAIKNRDNFKTIFQKNDGNKVYKMNNEPNAKGSIVIRTTNREVKSQVTSVEKNDSRVAFNVNMGIKSRKFI